MVAYFPFAIVAAIGLSLSLIAFLLVREIEQSRFAIQFNALAAERVNVLQQQIDRDLDTVASLAALYDSSREVERREFQIFAANLLSRHPSVRALEWLPRVPAAERDAYEQQARADGDANFRISELSAQGDLVPASPRESYFPVYYLEPIENNEKALGFDVASCPVRRQTLDKARATGELTTTPAVALVQDPANHAGFLVVLPIFAPQSSAEGPNHRSNVLAGYVLGVFNVDSIVDAAIAPLELSGDAIISGLQLNVYEHRGDDAAPAGSNALYHPRRVSDGSTPGNAETPSEIRADGVVRVGDRHWQVVVSAADQSFRLRHIWLPWVVLLAGLGATGVAAPIYQSRKRGIRLLNELARSLGEKNATLERVSARLAAYIPSQICQSIFNNEQDPLIKSKRRRLTIFFSDIVDFVQLSSDLEPEDLTFLLNEYFTEMSEISIAHGATIDKFIGDAMLMFFGDPETKGPEKDALACVSMAVSMQRRMADLREKWHKKDYRHSFHMRIGINTGYCHVGNFGSSERIQYTIIGNEVNKTARLQDAARPDSITLTSETYALVKEHFHARAGEPVSLKGFAREIRPYYIVGAGDDGGVDRGIVRIKNEALKVVVDLERIDAEVRESSLKQLDEIADRIRNKRC